MLGVAVASADEDFDVGIEVLVLETCDVFRGNLGEVPRESKEAVGGDGVVVIVSAKVRAILGIWRT